MPEYRPEVLAELINHGIRPAASTRPELIRRYLNNLYRYEIRRLRDRLLAAEFPKNEYLARVVQLRSRYQLLSLPIQFWRR